MLPQFGSLRPEALSLFTDRYELAMARGYREADHRPTSTFELFFRELPPDRGYVIAAGLEQAIAFLAGFAFDERAREALRAQGLDADFVDSLADWEFTGDVRAVPEGTPVFPNEPLLAVTAPIDQAQLLETLLVNQVGFQSLIATKAARMRDAVARHGGDHQLVDFGSRRAHGTDAGLKAARAAFVGGFDATSNVAAGDLFDLPTVGTMAHSWVQSFPSERDAFAAFLDVFGDDSVLLIDTYDTIAGAETAVAVADERGVDLGGVRLDSGDLVALSTAVAPIVGDADVFVSSGMDEYAIDAFLESGGVADGFGPGTALVTSEDAPSLDAVYKLVAVERDGDLAPSMKLSPGKVTYPGRKQVRRVLADGHLERDVLGLADEDGPGEELLVDVFVDGERVYDPPSLSAIRERAATARARLPESARALRDPDPVAVEVSDALAALTEETAAALERDR
ncbi:MAG: nicotinate phosphoribosyltransferase [Haloarculaceae archaeon]